MDEFSRKRVPLYERMRPQKLEDFVGQEHIVRTLKNQINSHRVAHAYLFSGSRGTGKTSIAKIFARSGDSTPSETRILNCPAKDTGAGGVMLTDLIPILSDIYILLLYKIL